MHCVSTCFGDISEHLTSKNDTRNNNAWVIVCVCVSQTVFACLCGSVALWSVCVCRGVYACVCYTYSQWQLSGGIHRDSHDSIAVARVTTHSPYSSGCRSNDVLNRHTLRGSDVIRMWSQHNMSSVIVCRPYPSSWGFLNASWKYSHFCIDAVWTSAAFYTCDRIETCHLLCVKGSHRRCFVMRDMILHYRGKPGASRLQQKTELKEE